MQSTVHCESFSTRHACEYSPSPMETLLQDIRYACAMMRRNTGFTTAGLLTLALGIGATTAVFSVVYGVLLRPLPYPAAERLVRLSEEHRARTRRCARRC